MLCGSTFDIVSLTDTSFRRQASIGPYIVDFVCFEKRLAIELDGGQHSDQIAYDSERTRWLGSQGFHVLRFWNNQVLKEVDGVKAMISKALGHGIDDTPHPYLPHKGEGERRRHFPTRWEGAEGTMRGHVLALAGGVGGAKLATGLAKVLSPEELTIVVNTGDDEVFHGLHVCPDLDTMMYALAGLTNQVSGWGIAGDTFNSLEMLGRYGGPAWFNLGDKDLATHIRRTELLRQGWTLSEATHELCRRLGVGHRVVPMSDDRFRTIVETEEGDLTFQAYFVKRQCQPVAKGVHFEDEDNARASPGFLTALEGATSIILCPSNPFLSIAPILAVPGVKERIASFSGTRVAVSPIVGGEAVRGPAAQLLGELGHQVSCVGVATQYTGICDIFLIDEVDRCHAGAIRDLGMRVEVAPTIMVTDEDKVGLASYIFRLLAASPERSRRG